MNGKYLQDSDNQQYSSSVPNICKIADCTNVVKANGYCRLHWDRVRKHGDPNFVLHPFRIDPSTPCEVAECKNKVVSKNLCSKHYSRKLKTGSATTPLKKNFHEKGTPCKVDDCKRKITSFGYCSMHYSRLIKNGDVNTVKRIAKYEINAICSVENCKSKPIANGLCNRHYLLMKNHGTTEDGKYVMRVRKAVTHDDGTRTCSLCERRLPIGQFHKDKASPDGFRSRCKECRINHVKNWYQDNRERQSTREKIRRQSNPEKYAEKEAERYVKDREKRINLATEHSHRRKARKLKTVIEKGISKKSLKKKFGTKCYYCQKEMDFSVGTGRKFNRDMATIEHLIPLARGGEHTWENTVLACRHCNISKNAKTEAEFDTYKDGLNPE